MLRPAATLFLLVIVAPLPAAAPPAFAQGVARKCLDAVTTGDAMINCQKTLVLLQRKQLELLADLRRMIAKATNRAGRTATNTAATARRLQTIIGLIERRGGRPTDFLFVSDLAAVGGSRIACEDDNAELCAGAARRAARAICIKLGYGGQYSHEFTGPDGADRMIRIKWVVCRP